VEALREGVPILVMPEGRLHWDPGDPLATGPTRPGVSRLAVAADVPVVPVAISGTETVWPASKRLPRFNPFRRKTVVIRLSGSLLHFESDDHEANTGEVMAHIRALLAVSAGMPPEGA
jgi:putative phosphoserine phosphatase/1-acylglycerol-3-phosphate O-acyltransferase